MFGNEIERLRSRKPPVTPGSSRGRRPPGWLSRALISLAAVLFIVCVGALVFALLFARGDPVVSHRIVRFISASIGSDSTRLESDRIRGSVFGGAVLENPRLVVLTPDGPVTWLRAKSLRAEYDTYGSIFTTADPPDHHRFPGGPARARQEGEPRRAALPRFEAKPAR